MTSVETDSLGRATFHQIEAYKDLRPTDRQIRWFKHIERHGPQSSEFLYELTRDTHRCKDTALRDLQKLRASGFLRLPSQQRNTARAEFNPYIYDLTRQAKDHLSRLGLSEPTICPSGHWWHGFHVSAVTGSLDIVARRDGNEYIPGHTILARKNASLPIPVGSKHLIPDQLFAIKYETGYRAFLLEVDRGTEPVQSSKARKSLERSIQMYRAMFASNAQRKHYGLRATTLVLWVFTNPVRMKRFDEFVHAQVGGYANRFLSKVLPESWRWAELERFHQESWVGCDGARVGL